MKNAEKQTEKTPEAVRKTVYLPRELTEKCETLFPIAMVDNFSNFTAKALNHYIDHCICQEYSELFGENVRSAIEGAMAKLASRISKGMYRQAIYMDVLTQLCADEFEDWELKKLVDKANIRVANLSGKIDLKLLSEQKTRPFWAESDDDNEEVDE